MFSPAMSPLGDPTLLLRILTSNYLWKPYIFLHLHVKLNVFVSAWVLSVCFNYNFLCLYIFKMLTVVHLCFSHPLGRGSFKRHLWVLFPVQFQIRVARGKKEYCTLMHSRILLVWGIFLLKRITFHYNKYVII